MYAVIRAGGKQYRVAPGDVIRVERQPHASNGKIDFTDVLAYSSEEGHIARPKESGARVSARVVEDGRAEKILVFHFKRKKQYKKLAGHRQPFTAVRITEIICDGHSYKAAEEPEPKPKKVKPAKAESAEHSAEEYKPKAHAAAHKAEAKHAKHKTAAHKKSAPKSKGKKK